MVFRPGKTQDLNGELIHGLNQTKIALIDRKTFKANLRESAALPRRIIRTTVMRENRPVTPKTVFRQVLFCDIGHLILKYQNRPLVRHNRFKSTRITWRKLSEKFIAEFVKTNRLLSNPLIPINKQQLYVTIKTSCPSFVK
jgi:hypothetical protein